MKINASIPINRYNGKPVMTDQEPLLDAAGQPVLLNGQVMLTGGREMTVGDVVSTILSSKKVDQFNVLKADVLARRFYRAEMVEIDEADLSALSDVIDRSDLFVPFVLAYVKKAILDAKNPQPSAEGKKRR